MKEENEQPYSKSFSTEHPLSKFPVFPLVLSEHVPSELIEMVSEVIPYTEAEMVINKTNMYRKEANPDNDALPLIKLNILPPISAVGSYEFWIKAFIQARLHGPRMLASLILTIPDYNFTQKVRLQKDRLLELLENYKPE